MPSRARVLIIDDSVTVRRLLSERLAEDPAIHVVGSASSGAIGLARAAQLSPDVALLDVEMPGLGGLETLALLRERSPSTAVIMFSVQTLRGASATIDALLLGARDYVTKPSSLDGGAGPEAALAELRAKIRECVAPAAPSPSIVVAPPGPARPARVSAIAIGVSTGGPNALDELFTALEPPLPVPVLIVQHMPPMFTRLLAEALAARTRHRVAEATDGALVEPGAVWVAPGDHHLEVVRDGAQVRLAVGQGPPESSCRPAVDVLFRSVARAYGAGALAVVMTGMGQDGLAGCDHVRAAGGRVLAQDEASSVVWGMPGAVAQAGLADGVVSLAALPAELRRRLDAGGEA